MVVERFRCTAQQLWSDLSVLWRATTTWTLVDADSRNDPTICSYSDKNLAIIYDDAMSETGKGYAGAKIHVCFLMYTGNKNSTCFYIRKVPLITTERYSTWCESFYFHAQRPTQRFTFLMGNIFSGASEWKVFFKRVASILELTVNTLKRMVTTLRG